ncbi:enhancer of mRNA-decapping protein 4 isoform X1 [Frankliniella occidentalis]|uniref:Enhancer of mRNA-decapping protein 4 isoform X1 n=1 Tax=Frankliniella occidentalis TaxID=133901 RepID=A0A6J1RTN8_FRAOC|nr:enhancer of mRNA-decapping protein 4 isoform X1 [Frankliniella occidentalis]
MLKSISSYFFAGAEEEKQPVEEVNSTAMTPSDNTQTVQFQGSDEQHSTEIYSNDVTIIPSAGNHDKSSSHVKTNNIVDHSWDVRFYKGQLLAVHLSGKFIAFGIQVVSKSESMVRIVNRQNNHRYLCKGITGVVQDIAFAHIATQVILGIVDEAGTLFIYRIEDTPNALQTKLILHVSQKNVRDQIGLIHRLIWCPYIPEEDSDAKQPEDEEVANMLVVTHGPRAEIWNVQMVIQKHGTDKELHPEDVKEGLLSLNHHEVDIVDAAFSPDGTALATASLDGYVKFFQVYMQGQEEPRCLHMWQPHDGKPLSSLFFLDNHRSHASDTQFWKYVLTGSENNSELKIWSCETWSCLQTISFASKQTSTVPSSISLKAGIDLSADFIMLSDINNRVLYVLQLQKDSIARVCAVSEFLLPNPILSFGIVDAGIRNVKRHHDVTSDLESDLMDNNEDDEDDDGGDDDDEEKALQVVIRMYVVHPKSLRGCIISFDPPVEAKKSMSIYSEDTLGKESPENQPQLIEAFAEGMSDVSENCLAKGNTQNSVTSTLALAGTDSANNLTPLPELHQSTEPKCLSNLMTPDDFSSSNEKNDVDATSSPLLPVSEQLGPQLGELCGEKTRQQADPSSKHEATNGRALKTKGKSNGKAMADTCLNRKREPTASGGSSPSREVEEILSHGSSDCLSSTTPFNFQNAAVPEDPSIIKAETSLGTVPTGEAIPLILPSNPCGLLPLALTTSLQASTIATTTSALQAVVAAAQEKPPVMVTAEQLEKQQTQWSRVDLLLETLQQQQVEIKSLRQELGSLRLAQTTSSEPVIADKIQALLLSQQKQLEMSIQNAIQNALQNSVQNLLRARDQQENQRQEALMSVISQTVSNIITSQLPTLISQEIQSEVVPIVRSNVQQMKQQVATEVATKLAATDQLMKDNLAKLVTNKSFMDMLNQSLLIMAQPTLQSLYKESFGTLVPTMEKVTQSMFHQINNSFSKGTQEYMQYVDGTVEKQRRQYDRAHEMLQSVAESMQTSHEQQTLLLKSTLDNNLQKLQTSLLDKLNKTVSDTVKGNLAQGFKQQKAVIEESVLTSLNAVRSRAVSPAQSVSDYASMERRVLNFIQERDYNSAFQQALSASSIALVLAVCERVDPQEVFSSQPFPLKQNVLLSLIQQLSVDLNDHTELKRRYLEEAVMSLDPNDSDVRKHLYIISKLQEQLMAFVQGHPGSALSRQMKMLYMATSNLVQSPTSPS